MTATSAMALPSFPMHTAMAKMTEEKTREEKTAEKKKRGRDRTLKSSIHASPREETSA